jgi:hypothetical protein
MSGWLAALAKSEHGFRCVSLHLCLARSFSQTHSETKRRHYDEIVRPSFFCGLQPSDLAIAIPDFHIAAVRELQGGLQRFGIAIGFNRLIRDDAIVSIKSCKLDR